MKISNEIKSAMAMKDIEQSEIAAHFGVSQQAVSRWIVNGRAPEKHRARLEEMLGITIPISPAPKTITQTATDNARQQAHTGVGNVSMFNRDGITLTGHDQRNPPPAVDADAWAELMHWISKHPGMVPSLAIKARELGSAADEVFGFR